MPATTGRATRGLNRITASAGSSSPAMSGVSIPLHRRGLPAHALHSLRRRPVRGPLRGRDQQEGRRHRAHRPGEGRREAGTGGSLPLRHDRLERRERRCPRSAPSAPTYSTTAGPSPAACRPAARALSPSSGRPTHEFAERAAGEGSRRFTRARPKSTAVCYKNLHPIRLLLHRRERGGRAGRRRRLRRPAAIGPPSSRTGFDEGGVPPRTRRPPTLSATSSSTGCRRDSGEYVVEIALNEARARARDRRRSGAVVNLGTIMVGGER